MVQDNYEFSDEEEEKEEQMRIEQEETKEDPHYDPEIQKILEKKPAKKTKAEIIQKRKEALKTKKKRKPSHAQKKTAPPL